MKMYNFKNLHQFLDKRGFPKVKMEEGFQIIKENFEKAWRSGKIKFEDGNIFYDGCRSYFYLMESQISEYDSLPKAHTKICQTIQTFLNNGKFEERYHVSNDETVDLIDRNTKKLYNNQTLDVCKNCCKREEKNISDTKDFYKLVSKQMEKPKKSYTHLKINQNGYTHDFEIISKNYRKSKDYTCEECEIKPQNRYDNKYWHNHHIDGDKTNNNDSNLQCLCIVCHSKVDETHRKNFSNSPLHQRNIENFKKNILTTN